MGAIFFKTRQNLPDKLLTRAEGSSLKVFSIFTFSLLLSSSGMAAVTCEEIAKVRNEAELTVVLQELYQEQKTKIYKKVKAQGKLDRHQIGKLFNGCQANEKSRALVISFEGTGSYDSKTFDIYRKLIRCLDEDLFERKSKKIIYNLVQKFMKSKGRTPRWSAISAGPHNLFLQKPELRKHITSLQFISYPSEETELLDGNQGLTMDNLQKIASDIALSSAGVPRGIANALACTKSYLASAKKQKIKPKLIVLTHSSGGRTAVKFLEHLKVSEVKVDLVFSMDPVKEAHEAVKEVVSQYSGNAARDLQRKFSDDVPKNKPVHVWSRQQPKVLYKPSNALQWINVYQNVDTLGLKGPVEFGIRGSPVHLADVNKFISTGLGADAHGAIAYHEKTSELFSQYFNKLFEN